MLLERNGVPPIDFQVKRWERLMFDVVVNHWGRLGHAGLGFSRSVAEWTHIN
jgi:hypothetical protein